MNPRVWLLGAARVVGMFLGIWGLLAGIGAIIRIAPGWSPVAIACGLALAAELLIFLYRYESRNLGPERARQLVALRLGALGLLAWILIEPTFVRTVKRRSPSLRALSALLAAASGALLLLTGCASSATSGAFQSYAGSFAKAEAAPFSFGRSGP